MSIRVSTVLGIRKFVFNNKVLRIVGREGVAERKVGFGFRFSSTKVSRMSEVTESGNSEVRAPVKMIDIAVNLADGMFKGVYRDKTVHQEDIKLMLQRARAVGVEKIIATGTNLEDSLETLELTSRSEFTEEVELYTTVGVHPTNCQAYEKKDMTPDEYQDRLLRVIWENPGKVVAVGECGLDYDRLVFCPKETQIKYFIKQLELASIVKLPLFLHNRNTQGDFLDIIKTHRDKFTTGVVHSYDGSLEEAQELIKLGLYIGLNGCSMKTAENLEVIKQLPLDRILIETDSPWCDIRPSHASYPHLLHALMTNPEDPSTTPQIYKKEKFVPGHMVKSRNEPCNVRYPLYILAELHQLPVSTVATTIYNNTMALFFPPSLK